MAQLATSQSNEKRYIKNFFGKINPKTNQKYTNDELMQKVQNFRSVRTQGFENPLQKNIADSEERSFFTSVRDLSPQKFVKGTIAGAPAVLSHGVKKTGKGFSDMWKSVASDDTFLYDRGNVEGTEEVADRGIINRASQFAHGAGEVLTGGLTAAFGITPAGAGAGSVVGSVEPVAGYLVESGMETETAQEIEKIYNSVPPEVRAPLMQVAEAYLLKSAPAEARSVVKGLTSGLKEGVKGGVGALGKTGEVISKTGETISKATGINKQFNKFRSFAEGEDLQMFKLRKNAINDYRKSLRPSTAKQKTMADVKIKDDKIFEAGKAIAKNKEMLPGKKLPETVEQAAESVAKTRIGTFKKYKGIGKDKGKIVPIGSVKGFLRNLRNPEAQAARGGFERARTKLLDNIERTYKGDMASFESVEKLVQQLNKDTTRAFASTEIKVTDELLIKTELAKMLRNEMETALEGAGKEYAALRKEYGALAEMEKDAARAFGRQLNKNNVSGIDYTNVLSFAEIYGGLMTGSAFSVARGGAALATKGVIKFLNNPDRQIKNFFKAAERYLQEEKVLKEIGAKTKESVNQTETIFQKAVRKQEKQADVGKIENKLREVARKESTPETDLPRIDTRIKPEEFVKKAKADGFKEKVVPINKVKQTRTKPNKKVVKANIAKLEAGETLEPVIISKSGRIVDGNHRFEAMKQFGMKNIPVLVRP